MREKSLLLLTLLVLSTLLAFHQGCKRKITFDNEPPEDIIISSSACISWTNRTMSFSAEARDSDGDPLYYTWSASGGSFTGNGSDSNKGGSVLWKAPDTPGYETVEVTVTDRVEERSRSRGIIVGEEIPSYFTGNSTLDSQAYPYVISKDGRAVIPQGSSVTIEEGVEVLVFMRTGGIEVNGSLNVEGGRGSEVVIAPYECGGEENTWSGIKFSGNTARGNISYLNLASAIEGVSIEDGARVEIDNSSFIENTTFGLAAYSSTELTASNCVIWNNEKGVNIDGANASFTYCSIRYSSEEGMVIFGPSSADVSIQSSVIANNLVGISLQAEVSPVINECSIYLNVNSLGEGYAIGLSAAYTGTDTIDARYNYFGRNYVTEEDIAGIIYDGNDVPGIEGMIDFSNFYQYDPND